MNANLSVDSVAEVNKGFEEREARERAVELGLEFVDLARFPINPDVLSRVEPMDATLGELIPFFESGKILKIAAPHPEKQQTQKVIQKLHNAGYDVHIHVCSAFGYSEVMKHYEDVFFHKDTVKVETKTHADVDIQRAQQEIFVALEDRVESMPAETSLSEIKITALSLGASDIHFQPKKGGFVLRFRIDGMLYTVLEAVGEKAKLIINRIKYEGGMRANISNVPQDGHSRFVADKREVDLRISSLPTPQGESIVIRILDSMKGVKPFAELGFEEDSKAILQRCSQKKSGIIVVCGPTGSGKTTTLYSVLKGLNTPDKKIVTLEDPVEYQIDGISQSQVREDTEYDFDTGLQALLRHDPDIMLVGEVRSSQTAKLAVEASLTGHLVLTSLHTNSALGVFTRLRNLGVQDFNLAPSLQCVFAQRLVRQVCPHCAKKSTLPEDKRFITAVKKIETLFPGQTDASHILSAEGCKECSFLGYKGRLAVEEVLEIKGQVENLLTDGASERVIQEYADKNGFMSLYENGVRKVLRGKTTYEEIERVLD